MRIVLVDLPIVYRRLWHASELEPMGSAATKTVAAVYEYAAMGDRLALCLDSPPYFRKALLADYKAQREKAPEQMHGQQRAVVERLMADGFLVWAAEGMEADDIIATGVAELHGHEITIVSGDKDAHQLLGPGVEIFKPATGEVWTAETLREKAGIGPAQVVDYLALVGDTADNIQGLNGVGPKTAAKWLQQYGTLESVIANAVKLEPARLGAALLAAAVSVRQSAVLIKLRTDAPIDVSEIFKERKVEPIAQQEEETVPVAESVAEPEVMSPTTAMVKAEPVKLNGNGHAKFELALEPVDLEQARWLSKALFDGRIFGAFPNAQAILGTILTGRTFGLDAVTSLRSFHNINGKQTMSATLIVGLCKRRTDICKYFSLIESSDTQAIWETHRVGDPNPTRMSYTIDEAKRAKLVERGGNWVDRPKTMLRHRAASDLARAVYPDIISGLYSSEEMEDAQ